MTSENLDDAYFAFSPPLLSNNLTFRREARASSDTLLLNASLIEEGSRIDWGFPPL